MRKHSLALSLAFSLALGMAGVIAGENAPAAPAAAAPAAVAATPAPTAPAPAPAAAPAATAPAPDAASSVAIVDTPEEAELDNSQKEHTYLEEFMDKMEKGGFTMIILLVLSIAGIAVILERLFCLNRSTMVTYGLPEEANRLFTEKKFDELRNLCRQDNSILGRVILAIVEHRECQKTDIQNIADEIGGREIRMQMQKCYPLAIIATLSPLLGLFGTVLGMIGAFDTVASAGDMGNAAILADDIAKALITTAGGLAVAIPMLGFYHYFRTRTNKYAAILEAEAGELYSAWFLRAQAETPAANNGSVNA